MSPDRPRLSTGDTIAFVALILALLGIAAVLVPPAYPNASVELYRALLWLCIIVAAMSAAFLIWHHVIQPRLKTQKESWGVTFLLAILCVCAVGFDLWDRHDNSRPKLAAGIVYTILGAVNLDGRMTPTVYIFAGIANTGTIQTAVTGYKISAKKDGNTYQGTIMAAPKVTTIYPVNPEIMGSQSFELHDDDSLSNKTIAAIQPGNVTYGYLMVTFKTVADYTVLSGGLEIIMTFNDVFRNQYTIDQTTHIVTNEKIPFLQFPGTHMFPDTK